MDKKTITFNEVPSGIAEILYRMESLETSIQKLTDNHTPPEDNYLTRQEAANLLRITLPTLKKWMLEGKFKGYRIGRRVLYKKNEIEHAIKAIFTTKKTR